MRHFKWHKIIPRIRSHFEQAAATAFRAEVHLSPKGKADWKAFQEEHGASAAERMADEWMKRHASIFDEDASFAFEDIDSLMWPDMFDNSCVRRNK